MFELLPGPGRRKAWSLQRQLLCVAAGLSATLSVFAAEPGASATFQARPSSLFYARVYHDQGRLFGGYSHDHVIHAAAYESEIRFDPAAPERCSARLRIAVASLLVDEPSLRARLGVSGTLDDADRKEVREHMLAEDQLDARRYPGIEIQVQSCVLGATPGQYRADVTVSIRGKAQKRAHAALVSFQNGRLSTSGSLRFSHADFGMQPYSAFLGAVRNLEPIDLVWSAEADPAGASAPR